MILKLYSSDVFLSPRYINLLFICHLKSQLITILDQRVLIAIDLVKHNPLLCLEKGNIAQIKPFSIKHMHIQTHIYIYGRREYLKL